MNMVADVYCICQHSGYLVKKMNLPSGKFLEKGSNLLVGSRKYEKS